MGVNNSVNIKKMREIAWSIHERADKMAERLYNVLEDVEKLQKYWKGQAYVDFAKRVNQFDDNFLRIERYFANRLPNEIRKKANVYAKAQGEKVDKLSFDSQHTYENVPVKAQGETLVFNEAKVQEIQDTIEKRFSNVENDLQRISDLFDRIPWTGVAKDTSTKIFKTNVSETISVMKKIKKSLNDNMKAAIEANRKAEAGNATTSEKADLSATDAITSGLDSSSANLNSQEYDWKAE